MMQTLSLSKLMPPGSGYTELKVQENRSYAIQLLNGTVTVNTSSASSGLMCRTFSQGLWGLASAPVVDDLHMEQTARKAIANANLLSSQVSGLKGSLPARPTSGEYLFFTSKTKAGNQHKVEFLQDLDAYIAGKYGDLASRMVSWQQLDMEKQILTSDGSSLRSMTPRSLIAAMMTVMHEGVPLQHYDLVGGLGEWEDHFTQPVEIYAKIDKIYQELMEKKDAVFAKSGTFDCVLDSRLAGILSHEAIGHTTEADLVLGGSIAGEYLGNQVASNIVTLIDIANTWDGALCPVPVFIDDEGTEATDAVVIENGILKSFMHNKETALRLGLPLTGNARAYEYFDEPLVRMRNTMIVPGKDKLKDMIASIENGYYLIQPSNGQADYTSEFMFGVTRGYEIKNGILGKPIKETTISGIAFDLLKTVTMISEEMDWTCAGMCGKKQMIPVGMGGPSIKCKVNIGGRS
jgi:TldD protein